VYRRRWHSIFILLTVWSGESSAELEKLGEKWWKTWLSNFSFLQMLSSSFDNRTVTLPWLSRIIDTSENHPKRLDSDNQINKSTLIDTLSVDCHGLQRSLWLQRCAAWTCQPGRSNIKYEWEIPSKSQENISCPVLYTYLLRWMDSHGGGLVTVTEARHGCRARPGYPGLVRDGEWQNPSEFGPRGIGMEFMTDSQLVISEKGSSDILW
jgi:hypothetical protein